MNDKFNEQKDTLVSLKHEISLLQQQVDYLIRNEKSLGLLDLDVMMNRTHTIYDQLCSIDISDMPEEDVPADDEELPIDEETVKTLFGIEEEEPIQEEEPIEEKPVEEEPIQEGEPFEEEEPVEEEPIQEEEPFEEEEPVEEEKPVVESDADVIENETEPAAPDDDGLLRSARNDEHEASQSDPNDFGFILNFEPVEEKEEETEDRSQETEETDQVYTTGDEIEMSIPQTAPPEEEIPYEPVIIGDMEEKEEAGFEFETQETLGDRLQQQEDHSLAAKLQHEAAVKDLRTAIGINDKFLLVNELFSGSMEKHNKSIENLNDLKTLNGALIYMNELRIELQWNSSNEAYKKLLELVHRKFEA